MNLALQMSQSHGVQQNHRTREETERDRQQSGTLDENMDDPNLAVSKKVLEYEAFLNERLKSDLKSILDERDQVYNKLSEYLQLKTVIENLKERNKEPLKTQVDLGCNFYVQGKVSDPSRIYVCVGYGFYVEFTLDEALRFIEKKTSHLTKQSEKLTKEAAKVKAHVKLVLEGLREIQQIDDRVPEKPRVDI